MRISEVGVDPQLLVSIDGSAEEGASLVGVAADVAPLKVLTAINTFVSKLGRQPSDQADNWTDRALPLGSLWGRQLVRQFGWEWSSVVFHDQGESKAIGVFAKDRSLAVYPWHFVFGCLENGAPVTILLSFNMLLAGKIPVQQEGGYVNLMDHVHHIIPPA